MKKLNAQGVSHILIPLLVIVVFAVGGTFMLVSSYAGTGTVVNDSSQGKLVGGDPSQGTLTTTAPGKKKPKPPAKPKSAPATPRVSQGDPTGGGTGSQTGGDGEPAATDQASTGTVKVTQPTSSKASFTPKPKPSGDIIAVTYVNDPEIDKKGDKDHRIGGFKVKIERQGGPNNCDNTKKVFGTTNKTKKLTPKGEKTPVLVHGTVHFLNCDAGEYKATLMKPYRSGYKVISPTVRTFTLDNNATEVPFFVVEKKSKTKASTTPSAASGTGGVAAPTN